MADFVLIHGGLHGAWCWEKLEPLLQARGHRTVAMDLPVDRPGAYVDDYAAAVLEAVKGKVGDRPYLVGHSMGGFVAPRVAHALPGSRIVFLCAGFAPSNEEERQQGLHATTGDFFKWLKTDDHGRVTMDDRDATAGFYNDLSPELARWALARLRPQWAEAFFNVPFIAPYKDRVAHVIHCADDRIVLPAQHRALAEERFGITPIELGGGHSPFLSRPADLADALDRIVAQDRA